MVVVFVLCIVMIITKIILTTFHLVVAIFAYSFTDLFHMFEMLNTVFTTAVVIFLIKIFPNFYDDSLLETNPDVLQVVSKVAYYQ